MKESLSKLVEMLDAQVKSIKLLKEFADAQVESIELLKEFALEFIELAEPSKPSDKDPLGLTEPPADVSDRWKIEDGHTPNDADIGDDRKNAWKFCFVIYRSKIYEDKNKEIACMIGHEGGDISSKLRRIYPVRHNGVNRYRYVKYSQAFVDRWVDIAKRELTKIHDGDEEYALSLLPIDNL